MDTLGRTLIRRRLNAGRFPNAGVQRPDPDDATDPGGATADPGPAVAHPPDHEHEPIRPLWICSICEQPWPCLPARRHLRATMPSAALGLFMVARLHQATADGIDETPAALYQRFLSWLRSRD